MSGIGGVGRTLALAALLAASLSWTFLAPGEGTKVESLLSTPTAEPDWVRPDLEIPSQPTDLSGLRDVPLTYATREPYKAPAPVIPVAPPAPSYRLAGTFISPGKPARALLVPPEGEVAARRVKPGDDLDGWTVATVEVSRVVLKFKDQSMEIAKSQGAEGTGGIVRTAMGAVPKGTVALLDRPRAASPPSR